MILCPRCESLVEWEDNRYRPFCSEQCKCIDLGHWATGAYRITAGSDENDDEGLDALEGSSDRPGPL